MDLTSAENTTVITYVDDNGTYTVIIYNKRVTDNKANEIIWCYLQPDS